MDTTQGFQELSTEKLQYLHRAVEGFQRDMLKFERIDGVEPIAREASACLKMIRAELETREKCRTPTYFRPKNIGELLDETMKKVEQGYDHPEPEGISIGFPDIDELGLLQPGELIVIAGPVASGKTSFIQTILEEHVYNNKKSALIFSTELSDTAFMVRFICAIARVDPIKLKAKDLQDLDWKNIARTLSVLAETDVHVVDKLRITPDDVKAARAGMERDLGLLIIDHAQYMYGNARKYSSREEEFTDIACSLKDIAREHGFPVIITVALPYNGLRDARVPQLSDLRGYGALESIADKIWLMQRLHSADPTLKYDNTNILLARNKHGCVGKAVLQFNKEIVRFENIPAMPDEL